MIDYLSIGGITLAVHCDDDLASCRWEDPFRRFIVPAATSVDLDLSVRVAPTADGRGGELLFDSGAVWRIFWDSAGYRIECRSDRFGDTPYKAARLAEDFSKGEIVLREDVRHLHPLDYPLDEVLTAHLLARGRGVELHSCGVIDQQGRGHLFVGVSGAGKTTTARLWAEAAQRIVSDDRVIVREQSGTMWMYGTPWHGEAELSLPDGVPLHAIYLLTQATRNELVEVTPGEAVARLFRCTFPLFYDGAALDFTISFLTRLASLVPVRDLRFVRDRSVIDLVLERA